MRSFLDKLFFRSNNLNHIHYRIKDLSKKTPISKIFEAINSFSNTAEIRYVGGCVRKIIKNEKVDDIDLATNLEPQEVSEALKKKGIVFVETGIEHGTITALIDNFKFEITSLREDISTDGRHAQVKFSKDWKKDALRRDFTINSIYSDADGNLFDPFNGQKDLENGKINFIGKAENRVQEDYLRILRYVRFFLNYSKHKHNPEIIRYLKMNLDGTSKLSKERLLDELRKILNLKTLSILSKDKICLEIIKIVFPQLKYFNIFCKQNSYAISILNKLDFIFLISLLIVDHTDNADYFLYKFNISKKNKQRIKNIDKFFKEKITLNTFTEKNMNKVFYYEGKEAVLDILYFRILKSKKLDEKMIKLVNLYQDKIKPVMPIKADFLMTKYKILKGKTLGNKLRTIEDEWVKNNFQISDKEVDHIVNN